MLETYSAITN